MTTTNDLPARLREHAAEHQAERDEDADEASLYGRRHGRIAQDLREAAAEIEATRMLAAALLNYVDDDGYFNRRAALPEGD